MKADISRHLVGKSGDVDLDSIRVTEVDAGDNLLDAAVPFQFDPASDYDAASNAAGVLTFMMKDSTAAAATRHYHVYFDLTAKGIAPASVNGAGKTTLFSLVTRLYDNVSGRIAVLGHDVRRDPGPALAALGVVFQTRALDADLTVCHRQSLICGGENVARSFAPTTAAEPVHPRQAKQRMEKILRQKSPM